ncbi:MAG TPA: nitrilase-related carbon-nitrogen hydrolase, partial [Myxococcota bacterium]|nr:nitrilase-related carbon-nitrogen hydrolase [Myxococcota bacterium]
MAILPGSRDVVPVGLIQMRCSERPDENLEKAEERIEEAARRGARVVCTQELFRSRYFCQSEEHARFALAETIPGPTSERLAKLAAARGIVIVASLFEKRAEGLYHNTAVVLDADGRLAGVYRKMHIPDDPLYYEKFYFTPGDLGFVAFPTRHLRLGTLVCWDQWFPEAARLTALAGAQVLFYPTAIGWQHDEPAE